MNENYRKFHSGRFGAQAEPIHIEYDTKIEGAKGVEPSTKKKTVMNEDQLAYQEDIKKGLSIPGMEGE